MKVILFFKRACLYAGLGFFPCLLNAQSKAVAVIIVPCVTGEIVIDGTSSGIIEANDAHKETLTFGEHYIQLKTATSKASATITVDENFKSIVRLGCAGKALPVSAGTTLINKTLSLAGLLSNDTENNYFGLLQGDELVINSAVLNKKGNATLLITDYNRGNEIYKREAFKTLENETVRIPAKGIYKITLYTDALFGKDASLEIKRVAVAGSNPDFSTGYKIKTDTTPVEVMNTTTRVYSQTNTSHPNRTIVTIPLPTGTNYFVYWIGVGQGAKKEMASFINNMGTVVKYANPLAGYGMKALSSLPAFSATETVDYQFMDTHNAQSFLNTQAYSFYRIKQGQHISADYSIIPMRINDLVLAMTNNSLMTGVDVEVKVVAFKIRRWMVMDE